MRRLLLSAAGMLVALQAFAADTSAPTITIKVRGATVDGTVETGISSLDELRVSVLDEAGQATVTAISVASPSGEVSSLSTSTMAVPLAQSVTASIAEGKGNFEIVKDGCTGKALSKSGDTASNCVVQVRALANDNGTLTGKLRISHPQKSVDIPLVAKVAGLPSGYLTVSADTSCTSNRKQSVDCGVLTVTNTGAFTVQNITVTKSGSNPDNFNISSNCPSAGLPKDGKCSLTVKAVDLTDNRTYSSVVAIGYQSLGTGPWTGQTLVADTRTVSADVRGWVSKLDLVGANGSGLDVTGPGKPAVGQERIVTVQNTGEIATQAIGVSLVGTTSFELTKDGCTGQALTAGGSCSITLRPRAFDNGALAGTLRFAQGGVNTDLTLSGVAQGWRPAALSFVDAAGYGMDVQGPGSPAYGTARSFQVRNDGDVSTGTMKVALLGANATNFELNGTNSCDGGTLDPLATCLVTVRPKATASGDYTATLRITQNQLNADLGLSGRASRFTPATLVMAAVDGDPNTMNVVGPGNPAYGSPVTFRVTNIGDFTTQPVTFKVSSGVNFDLVSGGTCINGTSALAAGESCTQQVRPKSTANGNYSASVSAISNNTVSVTMTGVGSMFNPAKLILAGGGGSGMNITNGASPSACQTLTMKNDGDLTSGTLSATITAGVANFELNGCGNTCTTSLTGGQTCNVGVRAVASANGAYTGSLRISATPGGIVDVPLSGTASGFCVPKDVVTGYGNCSASCGGGTRAVYWSNSCGSTWQTSESCNTTACTPPPSISWSADNGPSQCKYVTLSISQAVSGTQELIGSCPSAGSYPWASGSGYNQTFCDDGARRGCVQKFSVSACNEGGCTSAVGTYDYRY